MTVHEFIFTSNTPKRYYRHIVFWTTRLILQVLGTIVFFNGCFWECLINETRSRFYLILPEILFTYLIVYYVIPKFYLRNKYFSFSVLTICLTIIFFIVSCFLSYKTKNFYHEPINNQLVILWHYSMKFITEGPPIACILFLTIKMFKNHYQKLEEKQMLAKENKDAELQLLKAQVNPHFLFNTLNNIYSFTLNKSEQAGVLVKKLTSVFRYMTDDCNQALVPLDKELKMLQDYIGLEKVRYGNRISIDINISGDATGKMITPLLMIPLIENSFKHGTSQMLEKPWIILDIIINKKTLTFSLKNSRPLQTNLSNGKNGLGLKNVKKRLELIYPHEHELNIETNGKQFSVHLEIPFLEPYADIEVKENKINSESYKSISYAG